MFPGETEEVGLCWREKWGTRVKPKGLLCSMRFCGSCCASFIWVENRMLCHVERGGVLMTEMTKISFWGVVIWCCRSLYLSFWEILKLENRNVNPFQFNLLLTCSWSNSTVPIFSHYKKAVGLFFIWFYFYIVQSSKNSIVQTVLNKHTTFVSVNHYNLPTI